MMSKNRIELFTTLAVIFPLLILKAYYLRIIAELRKY